MRSSDLRFLLALFLPLFTALGLLVQPERAWMFTLLIWWGIAALDAWLPARSPAPVAEDTNQAYFRAVLRIYVALQCVLICVGAYAASRADAVAVLGIGFAVGFITGAQGITFAHELGHSKNRLDRGLAWILMGSVCYSHFMVEHYRGHHPRAATWDDPASARRGESLYRFLPRTLWGSWRSAWQLEAARLKQHKSTWLRSPLLWACVASVGMLLTPIFGAIEPLALVPSYSVAMKVVAFLLVQSAVAILLLEMVNYIEHYGLQRAQQGGRREGFGAQHAWNADHVVSNSILANLQRHSDHHMHAWKPYSTLQDLPDTPRLPTGYAGCIILAAIPPLWFALMHTRLAQLGKNSAAAT
jgi:alkane 1-monooxygenase